MGVIFWMLPLVCLAKLPWTPTHVHARWKNTYMDNVLALFGQVYVAADDKGNLLTFAWPAEWPLRPGWGALAPPPRPTRLHAAVGGITALTVLPRRGLIFTAR